MIPRQRHGRRPDLVDGCGWVVIAFSGMAVLVLLLPLTR